MADHHGTWRNRSESGGATVTTTHTLGDSTFATDIVYAFADGSHQYIRHDGTYTADGEHLRLAITEGTTRKEGSPDTGDDFSQRLFTPEEWDETAGLLALPIGYRVNGDTLHTTIDTPHGTFTVAYERVAEARENGPQ